MHATLAGLMTGLCIVAANAVAQPIPGADDPWLQDAAQEWLADEEPAKALWQLGEIAQDGNIAAQILVNRIYRYYVPRDFPELDRAARRELLPPDRIGYPPKFQVFEQPFRLSEEPRAMEASRQIGEARTFEEWRGLAERLRAAGMERVLSHAVLTAHRYSRPELDIEIVRYAEENIPLDIGLATHILFNRFQDSILLPYIIRTYPGAEAEEARQRMLRWGGSPWRDKDGQTLELLVEQGHWDALDLLYQMQVFDSELRDRLIFVARYDWAVEIIEKAKSPKRADGVQPTGPDLSRLGAYITADAARTSYLYPVAINCARYCDSEIEECVARSTLAGLAEYGPAGLLEPVISGAAFNRSPRGAASFMSFVGHYERQMEELGETTLLPQCLVQAAAAYPR